MFRYRVTDYMANKMLSVAVEQKVSMFTVQ